MSERNGESWEAYLRWKDEQPREAEMFSKHLTPDDCDTPSPPMRHVGENFQGVDSASGEVGPVTIHRDPPPEAPYRGTWRYKAGLFLAVGVAAVLALLGSGWHMWRTYEEARAVAAVERAISKIGLVTVDKSDDIKEVGDEFLALPLDLQTRVSNLDALELATSELSDQLTQVQLVQAAIDSVQDQEACTPEVRVAGLTHRDLDGPQKSRIRDTRQVLGLAEKCNSGWTWAQGKRGDLIRFDGDWWSEAGQSDGVCTYKITPHFTNLSQEPMNYVWFDVIGTNRVGDEEPDIDGNKERRLRVTGPIAPGMAYKDDENSFLITGRCRDLDNIGVKKTTIEFANGHRVTLLGGEPQLSAEWKWDA